MNKTITGRSARPPQRHFFPSFSVEVYANPTDFPKRFNLDVNWIFAAKSTSADTN